jgi:hypothetical protein
MLLSAEAWGRKDFDVFNKKTAQALQFVTLFT